MKSEASWFLTCDCSFFGVFLPFVVAGPFQQAILIFLAKTVTFTSITEMKIVLLSILRSLKQRLIAAVLCKRMTIFCYRTIAYFFSLKDMPDLKLKNLYGASTQGELALARAGVYPPVAEMNTYLEKKICSKHVAELLTDFDNKDFGHVKYIRRRQGKSEKACSLNRGRSGHIDDLKKVGRQTLMIDESKALFFMFAEVHQPGIRKL